MAPNPGGLTTGIRRKLQDGQAPEAIVQELTAGGMTQASAQRFVDRAVAEHASAPPLPDALPPPDAIDQFIQTKQAETAKSGHKELYASSVLMCSGIGITGISYLLADIGESYTFMWGPIAIGLLMYARAMFAGFANPRAFAWVAAGGSLAAPLVLGGVLFALAIISAPSEEEIFMAQLQAAIAQEAKKSPPSGPNAPTPVAMPANIEAAAKQSEVDRLLAEFERMRSPVAKCATVTRLANVAEDDRMSAYEGLELYLGDPADSVKACIVDAFITLGMVDSAEDIYGEWIVSDNADLRRAAAMGKSRIAQLSRSR